jgi:phenylalanyl-tRNA synthetase beta chain
MAGIETSSVKYLGDGFENIVSARINTIKSHPKAERLTICAVTDGKREYQIVCGAPNIQEGDTVPLGLVGAILPGGVEIKRAKIRGLDSEGMMCSERELGISDDHEGIMILPGDTKPGTPIVEALYLDDYLMELDITPNRGDCLSIYGIVREISALFELPLKKPHLSFREEGSDIQQEISISIEDFELCPRYSSRVIYDVEVAPSPLWLQRRLQFCGMRPINNIVDITNYLLLELGQPLHAFDLDLIKDNRIIVKRAGDVKTFTTLDGTERQVHEDTLLIWDGKEPVAIAGIMGGENSEVHHGTRRVLFESAHFDPLSVRRSRNRLGISTESSYRFERGVDPVGTLIAINRAITILSGFSSFTVCSGFIDEKKDVVEYKSIGLRTENARRITGMKIGKKEAKKVFHRLGFETVSEDRNEILVHVPSFRFDITREIDLIEEIARIVGYDKVPTSYPKADSPHTSIDHKFIDFKKKSSLILSSLGVMESINYSFISEMVYDRLSEFSEDFSEQPVALKNPISDDTRLLRPSLLPGLLKSVSMNVSRYNKNVRLFEIGKIFKKSLLKNHFEENRLASIFTGNLYTDALSGGEKKVDFYYIRSVLDKLLAGLGFDDIHLVPEKTPNIFQSDTSASIKYNNKTIGFIGLINAEVCYLFDISSEVFYFELKLDCLFGLQPPGKKYRQISRYPPLERDISFLIDVQIPVGDILEYVKKVDDSIIAGVSIFDIYTSEKLSPGKKSVGLRIMYQSGNSTLTEQEVNDIHKKIIELIENRFGGMVRSS